MTAFIHPQALCETEKVGTGTRIWAFAHVLPGASIGRDCNICDGVFIENDVTVGDAVTVKCGVQLWDGVRLMDRVFVGPNATFSNDRFPRSRQQPDAFAQTVVEAGASIGANATILPGVTIGAGAMIGAGAVVTRDVPPRAVIVGNPGRFAGYAEAVTLQPGEDLPADFPAKIVRLAGHDGPHGLLAVLDDGEAPFPMRRLFVIKGVPSGHARGVHAHRACHQLLIATSGTVKAVVDDGTRAFVVPLTSPTLGLHMPPMTWGTQFGHTPDSGLLVAASLPYDRDDYIFSYSEFRALAGAPAQ